VRFVSFEDVWRFFDGKTVAVVGSAPSILDAEQGFIDSHDIVVRINNYKCGPAQGFRTDVFYSFFGGSIRKTAEALKRDGVKLMMNKCPDAKPLQCEWHEKNNKQNGIDFRYIFAFRKAWWFGDVFVPTPQSFLEKFELLDRHIPTTGFSAILDVIACPIKSAHIAGFDFFASGLHNVDEHWKPGDPSDPIGHRPDLEAQWLNWNAERFPITFDAKLEELLRCAV
jgi:hypothetical protein